VIVIHVQVKIKPEKRSEFLHLIEQDVNDTHLQPGCVEYQWLANTNDPNSFTLYEEWESQADFDAFKNSGYFQQLNSAFAALIAEAPKSHYYAAEAIPA
jgi:quinol monooxygenase YgiN